MPKNGLLQALTWGILKKNIKFLGYKGDHSKSTSLLNLKKNVEAAIDFTIKMQYHLLKSVYRFFNEKSENDIFYSLLK